MASETLKNSAGLVTAPGVWARNKESLATAFNVDLSVPGIIQKRRGYSSNQLNETQESIWALHSSPTLERQIGLGALLLATGTGDSGPSTLRVALRNGLSSLIGGFDSTVAGEFNFRPRLATGPDGADVVTTLNVGGDGGPLVLDYGALSARRLGVPRGMGLDRLNTTVSAGSLLPNNNAARYAVVFVLGDPSGNGAQFGAPGMTTVVTNTSGATADVNGRLLLPFVFGTDITTLPANAYWVQVYRSAVQATSLGEPPSELALVFQKQIDATDVTNGYVDFVDATPDSLRGANLYTNILSGEDGIAGRGFINSNEPPPAAADVANWADCLWLSNIQDYPTQELQLIAVNGSGLVAGDTVTVAGVVYTAVAAAPVLDDFILSGGGTPSVNQRETALNLVDAINRSTNNTDVYAFYIAGQAGLPGRILLRGRRLSSVINASVSRAAAWRVGTEQANSPIYSGLAFSKPLQPSAWPVVNRFEIGRGDAKILRIIPYRDSLFVFKEDGLYRVTGSDFTTFRVEEFDLTFQLIGPELVATVDDAVWAWGRQGIARVTDGGIEYVDGAIRDQIQNATAFVTFATLGMFGFAVGNQRDGVVSFFRPTFDPSGSDPVACSNAFIFNVRTNAWSFSNWAFTAGDRNNGYLCGVSNVVDSIATLGVWRAVPVSNGSWIHNERRTYGSLDFSDPNMTSAGSPTMAAAVISSVFSWRPLALGDLGAAQWLRARFEFALTSSLYHGPPDVISVTFYPDVPSGFPFSVVSQWNNTTGAQTAIFVAPVDQDASRSHSIQPQVSQATLNIGFTLVSASIDFRPVSTKGVAR